MGAGKCDCVSTSRPDTHVGSYVGGVENVGAYRRRNRLDVLTILRFVFRNVFRMHIQMASIIKLDLELVVRAQTAHDASICILQGRT